jgi:D-amino-acid dehydrogenase
MVVSASCICSGRIILVDWHGLAGEETSYGNSGIIECASVFLYMFPRISAKSEICAEPHAVGALPDGRPSRTPPWLVRYSWRPRRNARCIAQWRNRLICRSLIEHEELMAEASAGTAATG